MDPRLVLAVITKWYETHISLLLDISPSLFIALQQEAFSGWRSPSYPTPSQVITTADQRWVLSTSDTFGLVMKAADILVVKNYFNEFNLIYFNFNLLLFNVQFVLFFGFFQWFFSVATK